MGKLFLNKNKASINNEKDNKMYEYDNQTASSMHHRFSSSNNSNIPMSILIESLRSNPAFMLNNGFNSGASKPSAGPMSFKIDDILNNNNNVGQEKAHSSSNRFLDDKNSVLSTSSSSSSSFSSPIPAPVETNSYNYLVNPNEFLFLNHHVNKQLNPLNPFLAFTQTQQQILASNYQKFFENNNNNSLNYTGLIINNKLGVNQSKKEENNERFFSSTNEKLTSSQSIMKENDVNKITSNNSSEETATKLNIVNQYAKQIDALDEHKVNNKKELEKNEKLMSRKKYKKKLQELIKSKKENSKNDCMGCSGNCPDLACSISSVLPLDVQLPMCLRGSSDEQLNLASLFNTLIHHKKCRRTRTVFTDMQLIGLEKRFENQKYLSTPDRIQLAESLGLSQLQVKTWYQNRRMKWKKKVLKEGCQDPPTKPKGRPKKNSIPSLSEIIAAAEANQNKSTGSSSESILSSLGIKNSDDSSIEDDDDDDEDDDSMNSEDDFSSDDDLDESSEYLDHSLINNKCSSDNN